MALTISRVLLVLPIIGFMTVSSVATACFLAAFIALDHYDGVIGRARGTDGPSRRAADSVVDRFAIHAVYLSAVVAGLLPTWLWALMLARDLYCAAICSRMMRERWVAIRADWLYRSFNLLLAAWIVLAPNIADAVAVGTLIGVLAWGLVVAADLTVSVAKVRRMPREISCVVLNATDLRRKPR